MDNHSFLMSLIPWGTEAILWVQSFSNPFLKTALAEAKKLNLTKTVKYAIVTVQERQVSELGIT